MQCKPPIMTFDHTNHVLILKSSVYMVLTVIDMQSDGPVPTMIESELGSQLTAVATCTRREEVACSIRLTQGDTCATT